MAINPIGGVVMYFSNQSGIPQDQIFCIIIVLLGIPLSIIHYSIINPTKRMWYSFIAGFILQFCIYKENVIHVLITTILSYGFILKYGRLRSSFWILGFTLIYLSSMHLFRYFTSFEQWNIDDPTSVYMMTLCKFSSVAFSYEDGAKDDKDIYNSYHRKNKLKEMPTPLEFFSYVYFYPTSTYGPSIEFKDFSNFIYLKGNYKSMPIKVNMLYGTIILVKAFIFLSLYGAFSSKFSVEYLGSEEFGMKSILYKFSYINISAFFVKAKYYGGWMLTYSTCIYSGFSYDEEEATKENQKFVSSMFFAQKTNNNEKENGNKIKIMTFTKGDFGSITNVETGNNLRIIIMNWNRSVHLWLKYCIFLRLINVNHFIFKNNFMLSSLITFIASSFWHGYYPCYYIFFITLFFFQQATDYLISIGAYDLLSTQNIVIRAIVSICIQFMINSTAIIFLALKWNIVKQYLINTYGISILSVMVFYICAKGLKLFTNLKQRKKE